jgi:hypothetical protein
MHEMLVQMFVLTLLSFACSQQVQATGGGVRAPNTSSAPAAASTAASAAASAGASAGASATGVAASALLDKLDGLSIAK